MENQSRFDLNTALQTWQQELAAQPNLTSEVRRELEMHVRDTVADLQQRGLNDEESFWLAWRRVGQPEKLEEEFEKVSPLSARRKYLLWLVGAVFVFSFFLKPLNLLLNLVDSPSREPLDWIYFGMLWLLFSWPVVAGMTIASIQGRSLKDPTAWFSLISSRRRFLILASIWGLVLGAYDFQMRVLMFQHKAFVHTRSYEQLNQQFQQLTDQFVRKGVVFMHPLHPFHWGPIITSVALIAIIVWLLPDRKSRGVSNA